eukprot:m.157181 g.157181  ORF g.157181 m.157181 type:complete len:477 (-) comp11727_c0_seq5:447-1877(-)
MPRDFDAYLADVYFNRKMMLGRDRLYKYIRDTRMDLVQRGLSRRYVMRWLQRQEVHQLFHPAKRAKLLQPTVPKEPFAIVALDLIDMASTEYNGYKWALTAVDLFSRKVYAEPLKSKEAVDVVKGLSRMLYGGTFAWRVHRHGSDDMANWTITKHRGTTGAATPPQMARHPRALRSDNGPEFKNALLTTFLNNHTRPVRPNGRRQGPTTQHYSQPAKPQSNGAIERANGFIKRQLKMLAVQHDDPNWPAALPTVLGNINQTWCRMTNRTPNRVEADFLAAAPTALAVRATIVKNVQQRNVDNLRGNAAPRFKVGDLVRVRLDWIKAAGLAWSRQVYRVVQVAKPKRSLAQQQLHRHVRYTLVAVHDTKCDPDVDDPTPTAVDGVYYNDDLRLYYAVDRCVDGDRQYIVERLVKPLTRTTVNGRATRMYEVKWAGYRERTVEPRDTLLLDVPHLVRRFETHHDVVWPPDGAQPTWKR